MPDSMLNMPMAAGAPMPRAARFYAAVLGGLALCAVAAVYMPRALSFLPGVVGVLAVTLWPVFIGAARPWRCHALTGAAAVVALAALSALWAMDSGEALERAGKVASVLLPGALAVTAAAAMPREWLARLWWIVPAVVALAAVLLNIEYMSDMAVYRAVRGIDAAAAVNRYELNRASVTLALLMLPCAGMVYGHMRRVGHGPGVVWTRTVLYVALFLPMVNMTESQTAQLVYVSGLLMLACFPAGSRMAWRGLALALIAGMGAAPFLAQYLFTLVPPPGTMDAGAVAAWLREANVFARLEIWDYVSRYALQNPVTGFGIEATRLVEAFDNKEIYQPGLTILHPHNGALQLWIEFGVLGIAAASVGVYLMLARVVAGTDTVLGRRIAGAAFAGAVLVALTSYGLWQGWWLGMLMLLAAVTVAAVRGIGAQDSAA